MKWHYARWSTVQERHEFVLAVSGTTRQVLRYHELRDRESIKLDLLSILSNRYVLRNIIRILLLEIRQTLRHRFL